ncbi:ABC transporter permease [Paracholeplasma manati]|jgi:putative aldouronate transport system permease protein|uniref:ABC transporter permease subunit n=1 Tax=Paracholeplasma manati TaxID=591373 RepID=A0ABT2Y6A7_9MOLU|nr:ABC transporter permease subunit [Paracholeplasma manati]MCV2232269.1 ABC transporter permease subunit [Paracholeplasma manati]MDG0888226.1 ABC transporter permease subunit [Paracholeplasma manati]MDX9807148.1 ABC transporter permease subunit [Acholeplasma sp.]
MRVNNDVKNMSLDDLKHELLMEELEKNKWHRYWVAIKKDWPLYVMLIPVILYFFVFRYMPIYGILAAFKNQNDLTLSVGQAPFAGFYAFRSLIAGDYAKEFWQAFRNTFAISMYGLIFGFPVPIILALFFSEIKSDFYRSLTQILTYLPKFISTVVITSIITLMLFEGNEPHQAPGVLTSLFQMLGLIGESTRMLHEPQYFRSIYIISGIWEGAGYGSIVYFAAIMAISPTNYEAARIDGANKLAQIRYVTLPGMAPTLTIMLILRIGEILSVGYEKIILLYNVQTYETADVISTFVTRIGGLMGGQSISLNTAAAADLFNSIIAMFLVLGANFISKRVSDTSLF